MIRLLSLLSGQRRRFNDPNLYFVSRPLWRLERLHPLPTNMTFSRLLLNAIDSHSPSLEDHSLWSRTRVPRLDYGVNAKRAVVEGSRLSLTTRGISNARRNASTRAIFPFLSPEKQPPRPVSNPPPWDQQYPQRRVLSGSARRPTITSSPDATRSHKWQRPITRCTTRSPPQRDAAARTTTFRGEF